MDKFIDRQKLEAHFSPAITGKDAYTAGEVLLSIQKFPSADVVPVVHAHWIKHGEPPWYVIECSECGAKWQTGGSWDANDFCGNCGAKMDEEVETDE